MRDSKRIVALMGYTSLLKGGGSKTWCTRRSKQEDRRCYLGDGMCETEKEEKTS